MVSGVHIAPHEGGGQSLTLFWSALSLFGFWGSHSTPRRRRSEFDTFLVCIKSFWILGFAYHPRRRRSEFDTFWSALSLFGFRGPHTTHEGTAPRARTGSATTVQRARQPQRSRVYKKCRSERTAYLERTAPATTVQRARQPQMSRGY